FVAAEEMGRTRVYWWAPDGERLAVARVDTSPVPRWHLSDLARPEAAPTTLAYPAAGTPNADVSLHVVSLADTGGAGRGDDAPRTEVVWDRAALPYLTGVAWHPVA